jgi:hypothetical protein
MRGERDVRVPRKVFPARPRVETSRETRTSDEGRPIEVSSSTGGSSNEVAVSLNSGVR